MTCIRTREEELATSSMKPIFLLDFGAECSKELNSPPAVSTSVNGGVAEPGGLFIP